MVHRRPERRQRQPPGPPTRKPPLSRRSHLQGQDSSAGTHPDFYHIFPRPDDHVWDGIEYHDPTARKGVVFIFKPDSPNDTQTIKLKGLDAKRSYRLTFEQRSNPQGRTNPARN